MRTIDELIAEAPTFAGLDQAYLELIAGCGWNQQLTAGTLLMRAGDAADRFFLIRHGLVTLELYAPGLGPLQIQTLDEGEVVGWICTRRASGRCRSRRSTKARSSAGRGCSL